MFFFTPVRGCYDGQFRAVQPEAPDPAVFHQGYRLKGLAAERQ